MSSVFENIDVEKQLARDQWVFDRLPLSTEQKAELLRSMVETREEAEEVEEVKKSEAIL